MTETGATNERQKERRQSIVAGQEKKLWLHDFWSQQTNVERQLNIIIMNLQPHVSFGLQYIGYMEVVIYQPGIVTLKSNFSQKL